MYLQTVNNFIAEALKKKDAEAEKNHKKHLELISKIRQANINTFVELWAIYEIMEEKAAELQANQEKLQETADNDTLYSPNAFGKNDPLAVNLYQLQYKLQGVKNEIEALQAAICEEINPEELKKMIKEETKKRLEA